VTADQLRRAAEQAEHLAGLEHPEWLSAISQRDATVAALLRAAADAPPNTRLGGLIPHRPSRAGCRLGSGAHPGPCPACLLDDVAAAYLGEQVEP
jgi:hypothetical protein